MSTSQGVIFLKKKNVNGESKWFEDGDEENDEYLFHLGSYWWFRRTQYITSIGLNYKNKGSLLREILPYQGM